MVGYVGKKTNSEGTRAAVMTDRERADMWGPTRGEIVSFDPATQTATVKIKHIKKDGEGNDLPPPDLEEVPVDFGSAGGGRVTFPVKPGDQVMLKPSMRSEEADADGKTDDRRSAALSDMRATVEGGNVPGEGLANFDAENTHFGTDSAGNYGLKGNEDGKVGIIGKNGELFDLLNQVLTALKTEPALINTGTYSDVDGKVGGMKL